jgi:small subunit ribosomal protein S9
MKMSKQIYATGRRKTAVAKVWLTPGTGKISVNDRELTAWLQGFDAILKRVIQPLEVSKQLKSVDIKAVVAGSGYSAQADAVRHGISRALCEYDADFRKLLKPFGLLTRDSRKVERKKYGRKKARKSPQFSKR